jgi:thioredoxin-like negative regulator of GroEL
VTKQLAGSLVLALFVMSSQALAKPIRTDPDRPAFRLLLAAFENKCDELVSRQRASAIRADLVYGLSAVPGVAAQAISMAEENAASPEQAENLVAEYDGNTLLQVRLQCDDSDRIGYRVLATRIAPDGQNAGSSGVVEANTLAVRNALFAAILRDVRPDTEVTLYAYDRQAFDFYLDAVNPASDDTYTERLEKVREATNLDAALEPAWLLRGSLALSLGEKGGPDTGCYFAESDNAFRRALDAGTVLPLAIHGLASVQMRTGQTEAAAAVLRAGLVARPDFALLHAKLGYVDRYAGKMSDSVNEYWRSQALDQGYDSLIEAERQIVKSHIYSNRPEDAFASYEKILQWLQKSDRQPDEKMLFYQGVARLYARQPDRAIQYFDASIADSPGTVWSDFAAAYRAAATGENSELILLADRLATGNVSDGERRYRLAHLYSQGGDSEKALFHLYESARSGFFNYPYTRSDMLLANISDLPEFSSVLQFIYDRHTAFAKSATDQSISRNTYEEAIRQALGLDYSHLFDNDNCAG